MQVHLKILRLQRALSYRRTQFEDFPLDDTALERCAQDHGETLLALRHDELITMTEDGPRIVKMPRISELFLANTAPSGDDTIELKPGAYLFYQWRRSVSPGATEQNQDRSRPFWVETLEEVAREAWWQGIALEGQWYLRLVPEDDGAAFQVLRSMHS